MSVYVSYVVVLLVVVVSQQSHSRVDAIRCYQCTSQEAACKDPFKATLSIKTCKNGQTCTKSKGSKGGKVVVERGCSTRPTPNKCETRTVSGVRTKKCGCSTEFCNGAVSMKLISTSLAPVTLLLLSAAAALATSLAGF